MLRDFDHVVLFCADTERSRQWYEKVGFSYLRGYEGMHWFGLGGVQIMLHPAEAAPSGHRCELYARVDDIDAFFAHLKEQGLSPRDHQQPGIVLEAPVERPWGTREIELLDPDGHEWGFVQV